MIGVEYGGVVVVDEGPGAEDNKYKKKEIKK
jgi:hypothetical protein